ncbi:terpene synthase family protein [Dyella sp.]
MNDLYSVAWDAADVRPVCHLVLILAAEQGCSLQDAVAQVV